MQHKTRTMPSKQTKNEHHYITTRQKKKMWPKNEAWASFLYTFLSLTLNNAFASLGGDDYLGTLNPKLSRIRCKFYERTCTVLQNK